MAISLVQRYHGFLFQLKKEWMIAPYYNIGLTVRLTWSWLTSIRRDNGEACRVFEEKKNLIITNWLLKRYGSLIPEKIATPKPSDEPERIFVFWYQGINDSTPDVVRLCVDSIMKNANGREVVFITKGNIRQWANIPDYIYSLVDEGVITLTHLSDILRVCLLYQHGGYWIDATVFLTEPLREDNFNKNFGSIKIHDRHTGTISAYRWTGYFLRGVKGSTAMKTFRDVFFAYWKDGYKKMIDYFLIDYVFEMMYRRCPDFRAIVDNCPYTNEHIYEIDCHINDTVALDAFLKQMSDTTIFKLNWKHPYHLVVDGKPTLFGQLMSRYGLTKESL